MTGRTESRWYKKCLVSRVTTFTANQTSHSYGSSLIPSFVISAILFSEIPNGDPSLLRPAMTLLHRSAPQSLLIEPSLLSTYSRAEAVLLQAFCPEQQRVEHELMPTSISCASMAPPVPVHALGTCHMPYAHLVDPIHMVTMCGKACFSLIVIRMVGVKRACLELT